LGSKSSRNARTNRNRKDQSVRRVFGEVAQSAAYDQYAKVGFAFFKLCRNGLAHGFYPNDVQLANGPKGGVAVTFWLEVNTQRSICADEIGPQSRVGTWFIGRLEMSKSY